MSADPLAESHADNLISAGASPLPAQTALLIDTTAVTGLLSISKRHLMRLLAAGEFPPAVRVGRCLRWRRVDVEGFVTCGCDIARWRSMQRGKH